MSPLLGFSSRIRRRFFLLLFFMFLLWVAAGLIREMGEARRSEKNIDRLKAEITNLERKNGELRSLIEYFKTDAAVEREARERLNLKKPGENVVIILDEEVPTSTNSPDGKPRVGPVGNDREEKPNFIEAILNFMFH